MDKFKRITGLWMTGLLLLASGCRGQAPPVEDETFSYRSYRDIPGITENEIKAIEALKTRRSRLVYGMTLSTDAFYDQDGRMKGFSLLFCQWLTDLFGITFETVIYEWDSLLAGLLSREIDFTGELTKTEERLKTYFMTDAIAERGIKLFRIQGSGKLGEIAQFRPLRYAFLEGTITHDQVAALERNPFEAVFVDGYDAAYRMLRSGEIDAYIEEEVSKTAFIGYPDMYVEDFFPLTYSMVSMSTANPELEPIIAAVQKVIDNGFIYHILSLHDLGREDYNRYETFVRLSEDERNYIRDRTALNLPIPVTAEYDNYPCSFYNASEKAWQGIAFDVLKEIEGLTGLAFRLVNPPQAERPELLAAVETGRAAMITALIRSGEQEGRFLLPPVSYQTDYYSLISRFDYRDINLHEINYRPIGLVEGAAFSGDFQKWFPLARTRMYQNINDAWTALEQGEVDLVMATNNLLLGLTNYKERLGFKANIIFKESQEYTFGFNPEQAVLCSIISKTMQLIDTEAISERWSRRVFDYRGKLARAQIPWLIGLSGLMLCLLVLLMIILQRHRLGKKDLERMVRRRTKELELQTRLVERASQAKSAFLARMSHEIRTPLNAIIGLSEVELQDEIPPKTRINLEKIYSSGSTLLEIINDILDISKIEAGNYEITPVNYDVAGIINDTIQLNIVRIGSKPIEFRLKLAESLPRRLFGDELRIKQILNNLLSNAIKYTEKGEVILGLDWERQGDTAWLHFSVRDTGRGIKKGDLEKLFSEYTQLDILANRKIEGTGLGLSITKGLVQIMGGSIKVESEYGEGSLFEVRLPQGIKDEEPLGRELADQLRGFQFYENRNRRGNIIRRHMPYGKVLVVDDVMMNLDVIKGLMMPYRLQVDTAMSGQEAVDLIRKEEVRYDLVFMDHMMPEMDGIQAVGIIRTEIDSEYARNIPIIALTANAMAGNRELFLNSGFNDFISKPIDIKQLDMALNIWVRDTQSEETLKHAEEEEEAELELEPEEGEGLDDSPGNAEERFFEQAIKGLNLSAARALYGDSAAYLPILRSFVVHTPALLEKMPPLIEGALPDYAVMVHGLKGSCSTICAPETAEMARDLETAAKGGNVDFVRAHHGALEKAVLALVEELAGRLGAREREPAAGAGESRSAPDQALLERLAAAAGEYKTGEIEAILKELEQFRYEDGEDLVRWLREQADNFEYGEMQRRLKKYPAGEDLSGQ